MPLFAIILLLSIQLCHIFAFPPDPTDLSTDKATASDPVSYHNLKGYECGNVFFGDLEIDAALRIALASVDKGYYFPQKYQGKLYNEAKYKEYLLWPIRKGARFFPKTKSPKSTFRIVFTRENNNAVDVVAQITTNEYTKCIRRDSSYTELSTLDPENPNGYLCSQQFFTDEFIEEYIPQSLKNFREKGKSLSPYNGILYPDNSGYWILPILYKGLHKALNGDIGPYCLVIDEEGRLIDAMVRGFSGNLLRCIRSRKPPKAPVSDPFTKLFVSAPKSGYQCGKVFFDDMVLEENAKIAKNDVSRRKYTKKYCGDPFNEPCLIWPILKDGSLIRKGNKGIYRLVLTREYRVKNLAMVVNGELKACERNRIIAKENQDTSDYLCNGRLYTHQQLVQAAEEACNRKDDISVYPLRYEGPGFEKGGPYFIYPVLQNGIFLREPGFDRVVINIQCEIVGAITASDNLSQKKYLKCHRLDDGPLPVNLHNSNHNSLPDSKFKH